MPSRNEIKEALPDGIYHAFNRGVERRTIFLDRYDYSRFLAQMRRSLDREPSVTLLAYALMPNHFHVLVQQSDQLGMSRFMRRLSTGYAMYFNKRYKRVGSLFQGKYKAVRVIGPAHLIDVSRYIHLNSERAGLGWSQQAYSSLADYVGTPRVEGLVDTSLVLSKFDNPGDYRRFMSKL
jgi:putative transposase